MIPPVPEPDDPEYAEKMRLRELVTQFMIHTPCENNDQAYCRKGQKGKKRRCSKWFPHEFNPETTFNEDGYVKYKRPADGEFVDKIVTRDVQKPDGTMEREKKTVRADNRHVVAYSPELLLRFGTHINVEVR